MASFAMAGLCCAQTADTLTVQSPEHVTVCHTADATTLLIEGSQDNPAYRYEERIALGDSTTRLVRASEKGHEPFGLDFTLLDNQRHYSVLEAYMHPSIEVSIPLSFGKDVMPTRWYDSSMADVGLLGFRLSSTASRWWYELNWGVNFSLYTFKRGHCMLSDADGIATMQQYPAGSKDGHSTLFATSSRLSFLAHRDFGKVSSVGLGIEWFGSIPRYCSAEYTDASGKDVTLMGHFAKDGYRSNRLGVKLDYRYDEWPLAMVFHIRYMSPMFKSGFGP